MSSRTPLWGRQKSRAEQSPVVVPLRVFNRVVIFVISLDYHIIFIIYESTT
jgi:hypothetical protein